MAWWLAYEELYGDMDKEYPIMTDKVEHSDSYYDYNRNDVNLDNPFTDPKDRERAEKVVGKYPRQVWPSLKDDCYPTLGSTKEVDEVYAHHFPGNTKPEPDLKGAAVQKYKEDTGINFIAMDIALYTGLTYAYILLMIFPLYNAIESLDTNQLEASKDLGSSTFRTHWRIVIPHAKAGIASGCTMVFMLTAGALATPVVLSSPNTYWFTQLIYQWFNMNDNWSRGSAYSILLLTISVVFVLLMMKIFKVKIGEIVR